MFIKTKIQKKEEEKRQAKIAKADNYGGKKSSLAYYQGTTSTTPDPKDMCMGYVWDYAQKKFVPYHN